MTDFNLRPKSPQSRTFAIILLIYALIALQFPATGKHPGCRAAAFGVGGGAGAALGAVAISGGPAGVIAGVLTGFAVRFVLNEAVCSESG